MVAAVIRIVKTANMTVIIVMIVLNVLWEASFASEEAFSAFWEASVASLQAAFASPCQLHNSTMLNRFRAKFFQCNVIISSFIGILCRDSTLQLIINNIQNMSPVL